MKNLFLLSMLMLTMALSTTAFGQGGDVDPLGNSTKKCLNLTSDLRVTSTGSQVSDLQFFLQSSGYLNSEPTGYFGLMTFMAVQQYQVVNSIVPKSGFVGPLTRTKINSQSCDSTQTPVAPIANISKIYFLPSFFGFNYTIGDVVSDTYDQQIVVTNGTSATVDVKISINNKPMWLNTSYSKDVLNIAPGQHLGIGVSVNPAGLGAGTYKTEITVSGNFVGSPVVIPVTLNVHKSSNPTEQSSLQIISPLVGRVWTIGDDHTFRWTTESISHGKRGYIELINSSYAISRIANIKNTGRYEWKVGDVYSGMEIKPGDYLIRIVVDGFGDVVGPLTITQGQSYPLDIKAKTRIVSSSIEDYHKFALNLSGGSLTNPVKMWSLKFTCPPEIPEVNVKVNGNVCDGTEYRLIGSGVGDSEVPLTVKYGHDETGWVSLKVRIQAIGMDEDILDEIDDYVIFVQNKG